MTSLDPLEYKPVGHINLLSRQIQMLEHEERYEKRFVWHHSICLFQILFSLLIQNTEQCHVSPLNGNSLFFLKVKTVLFQYVRKPKYKEKNKLIYSYQYYNMKFYTFIKS